MMAAALNFPQLPAIVYRNPPLEVGSTVLIPCDGDFDIEHADALTASGEIDGDFRDQGFWGGVVQVAPDADWWFDSPRAVAQLTTIFKRVHPAAELPPQMFFADEWIGYFDPSRASDEDDDDDPRTLLGRMRRFLERLGEPN
ncbi:MAG: hypothetical protein ABI067_00185 [Leifsonia sp.]